MAFRSEVNDCSRMKAVECILDGISVGNVSMHEPVARIVLNLSQVFGVAGVSERIKINYGFLMMLKPLENEV